MAHAESQILSGKGKTPPTGEPAPVLSVDLTGASWELRSLLFENDSCLFRCLPLFAVSAGNVTERNRLRERAEFPQREFSLGIGIRIRACADQRTLTGHPVVRCMLGMVRHLNRRDLA